MQCTMPDCQTTAGCKCAAPPGLERLLSNVDQRDAEIIRLRKALSAAGGYLMNAKIDLSTGCTKATAIKTIEGGIKMVNEALESSKTADMANDRE